MLSSRLMPVRYFTPQEANDLVPTLRAYFRKILEHQSALLNLERQVNQVHSVNDRQLIKSEISTRELGQSHLLERIDALGIQLIDPLETGQARFPALRNGEPVWLVWSLTDRRVQRWAPMRQQIFGTRPVEHQANKVRWEWRN